MEQEILQALLNCIEKHPEEGENKTWFTRLIKNSLSCNNSSEIDTDLIYNATVIESILANLLSQDPIVLDNITYDIIDKNIINVTNYNIRNRKFEPLNPFFITRNKSYYLEVLAANTSGDTREDQIAYIRNILKLSFNKNSNL